MNNNKKFYLLYFLLVLAFSFFLLPVISTADYTGTEPAKDVDPWHPELASSVKFVSVTNAEIVGFAIDSSGYPWTWGFNGNGRTGIGVVNGDYLGGMKRIPFFVENNIKVKSISSSYRTSFALTDDGEVYSWGDAGGGALGTDDKKDNPTPKKIKFPEKIEMVDASDGTGLSAVYAIGKSGVVYCWGNNDIYTMLLPGIKGSQSTPVVNTLLTDISKAENGVKQIKLGYDSALLLTGNGNVYAWGNNGYKATGILDSSIKSPKKIPAFNDGEIKEIDIKFQHSLFLKKDGTIYEAGYLDGKNANGTAMINKEPTPVKLDLSSAEYIPQVREIHSSKYAGYFIDQHGRSWVWGNNQFYQFMTDGPTLGSQGVNKPYDYTDPSKGKLSQYLTLATQIPKSMGDGDTQVTKSTLKAPVFSNVPIADYTAFYTYGYQNQGVWGPIDGGYPRKHPTIYDKKYYKTVGKELDYAKPGSGAGLNDRKRAEAHEQVYMVDKEGNKLVYSVIQDSSKTLCGNFYIADPDYRGGWYYEDKKSSELPQGVSRKTSVPEVKDSEKSWINLSTGNRPNDFTGTQATELPYIAAMDAYESAVSILDTSGNLYRSALNGSGNVAWGWDFSSIYDSPTNAAEQGIYDIYVYEMMFMRGAPRTVPGTIDISSSKKKHYLSNKEKDKVKVQVGLGAAFTDAQLNIVIEPKLNEVKYLVLPYSNSDENIKKEIPSKEEFNYAYEHAADLGYTAVDLAEKNGWKGMEQKLGQPEIQLKDDSLEIEKNSVVWAMIETTSYGATPTVVKNLTFDNFYTDATIKSEGSLLKDSKKIIYDALSDNVAKVNNDGQKDKYGFPLDVKGNIINNPTFGYDEVKVKRVSDDRLDQLDQKPKFSHMYKWASGQSEEKTYTLNGVDNIKNSATDIVVNKGELPVSKEFNHKFYYEENPDIFYNLHYVGVDKNGKKLSESEFKIPDERLLLKEIEMKRKAPMLFQNKELVPTKYLLTNKNPEELTSVKDFKDLSGDKSVAFTIPYDKTIKDVTLYYLYDENERDVLLNIRQVVLDDTKVKKPHDGYMSYQMAKNDWTIQSGARQVKVPSQLASETPKYKKVKMKVNKDINRLILDKKVPQYYDYVGFKQSNKDGNFDTSGIKGKESIKIDYSDDAKEKWVTVYIKPTTDSPGNYTWQTETNDFGKIYLEKSRKVRITFYGLDDDNEKLADEYTDFNKFENGVLKPAYDDFSNYYYKYSIPGVFNEKRFESGQKFEDILIDVDKIDVDKLPEIISIPIYHLDKNGKEAKVDAMENLHPGNPNLGYTTVFGFNNVKLDRKVITYDDSNNEIIVTYRYSFDYLQFG